MINSVPNSSNFQYFTLSTPSQMISSVKRIAPIALAFLAISSLSTVEAGPWAYISCVAGCETWAIYGGGPGADFITKCIQYCVPAYLMPTP